MAYLPLIKFNNDFSYERKVHINSTTQNFNLFFRADALNQKSIKSNGLGLSIAQKVCDLLTIELAVSSDLAEGTAFTSVFE